MLCSLTVLALIFLYDGHCFLVQLPSKVTLSFTHRVRLPVSCNNVPQHIKMFPDSKWWQGVLVTLGKKISYTLYSQFVFHLSCLFQCFLLQSLLMLKISIFSYTCLCTF